MAVTVSEIPLDVALSKYQISTSDQKFSDYLGVLDCLEKHECWFYWFDLVQKHCAIFPDQATDDYVRMIRVNLFYLENIQDACLLSKELIKKKSLSYVDFRKIVIDKVLALDDFQTEGALLRDVWNSFQNKDHQIAAIERLCFIFEKKSFNEKSLHDFYERLWAMSPENSKALKYFRNLYSQSQDWQAVVEVLKKLLKSAKHKQEVFRHAQELAAVYLYQLNSPDIAIRYIEEYCAGSTLDTSTIHYEAYYRLGQLEGCLRVLRAALLVVEDPQTRAIVHYRIGSLFEQLNNLPPAIENYNRAIELSSEFMEAIEGLISCAIKQKEWTKVRDWLNYIGDKVRSKTLAQQIRAGIQRLDEGLTHAATQR